MKLVQIHACIAWKAIVALVLCQWFDRKGLNLEQMFFWLLRAYGRQWESEGLTVPALLSLLSPWNALPNPRGFTFPSRGHLLPSPLCVGSHVLTSFCWSVWSSVLSHRVESMWALELQDLLWTGIPDPWFPALSNGNKTCFSELFWGFKKKMYLLYTFLSLKEFYKCWFISLHINIIPLTMSMFFLPLKLYFSTCGPRTSNIGNARY